jgi:hypothetical protein
MFKRRSTNKPHIYNQYRDDWNTFYMNNHLQCNDMLGTLVPKKKVLIHTIKGVTIWRGRQ